MRVGAILKDIEIFFVKSKYELMMMYGSILLLVNSSACVTSRAFNKVIYWCLPHIQWGVDV